MALRPRNIARLYSNVVCGAQQLSATASRRPFATLQLQKPIQQARARLAPRADSRAFASSSRNPAVYYVQFGGNKGKRPPRTNRTTEIYIAAAIGGIGGLYYIAHLEQVPETGRWRFMDVSAKMEQRLGEQMLQEILHEHGSKMLPAAHPYSRQATAVVRRIIQASGLGNIKGEQPLAGAGGGMNQGMWHSDERLRVDVGTRSDRDSVEAQQKEWDVHVVLSDEPNAFTTFGGHVVVFTGILPICRDDDGLAAVLGHEIAHVVARHPSEKVSLGKVLAVLFGVLELVGLAPGSLTPALLNLLLSLPNSRQQEYEADRIGLKLMARACFDPRASPAMFARLGEFERQRGGSMNMELLRTHPLTTKRIEMLESYLPEAYSAQAENGLCGDTAQRFDDFSRALGIRRPVGPGIRGGTGWGDADFVKEGSDGVWR